MRFIALLLACAATPALAQEAAPARNIDGRIERSDARTGGEPNRRYDSNSVYLDAGQRYRITVVGEGFDSMLEIYRPGTAEPIASNDDGDGVDPRLIFAPPASGTYILRVLNYSPDASGAYRITVAAQPPLPEPVDTPPTGTATLATRIWEDSLASRPAGPEGRPVMDYRVRLAAGSPAIIDLRADANGFDPLVQIFRMDGRDGEPIAADDDGGAELNALLVYTPEAEGDYVIRVTSFGTGPAGRYQLRVSQ